MAIPRIIHQTYKNEDVPAKYRRYRENLIALHPAWEYKFYDDEACRDAVEQGSSPSSSRFTTARRSFRGPIYSAS